MYIHTYIHTCTHAPLVEYTCSKHTFYILKKYTFTLTTVHLFTIYNLQQQQLHLINVFIYYIHVVCIYLKKYKN